MNNLVIEDAAIAMWRWAPEFMPHEFINKRDSGQLIICPEFMDKLHHLRRKFARPMAINSSYRTPAYNNRISKTGFKGPHTTGRAVDIRVAGDHAYALINLAFQHGFTGIGINQKGSWDGRFVHLDDLTYPEHPRPRVWSY